MYRSGTPAKALENDDEMYGMLKSISNLSGYQSKLLVGDFNLNKIKWTPDPELHTTTEDSPEYKFVECIRDTFLVQHITEPTRYRDNKPHQRIRENYRPYGPCSINPSMGRPNPHLGRDPGSKAATTEILSRRCPSAHCEITSRANRVGNQDRERANPGSRK